MFVHSAGAEVALAAHLEHLERPPFLFLPRGGARQQSSAALPTLSLRCAQVATPSRWGLPHRHAFPISALQARLRRTMLPAPTSAAAEPCHRSHQIPSLRNKTDRGRGSLHETEDARTQRRAKPPLTSHDCRPRAFCSPTRCHEGRGGVYRQAPWLNRRPSYLGIDGRSSSARPGETHCAPRLPRMVG